MKKLNIAIIGCGSISNRHAEIITNELSDFFCLKSVCDIDKKIGLEFSKKFNSVFYQDISMMLQDSDIDVVSILTHSGSHKEVSEIVSRYPVHQIVEKPIALTLDDANQMIHSVNKNNKLLFTVKQNRFNPIISKLFDAYKDNKIGKINLCTARLRWCRPNDYYEKAAWRGTWEKDGGVLCNQAIHHIDLLQWFMGQPDEVHALSSTMIAPIESEDVGVITMKFKNNSIGVIEATTCARPKNVESSFSIISDKGVYEVGGDNLNKIIQWTYDFTDGNFRDLERESLNNLNNKSYNHAQFYLNVYNALLKGADALIEGTEGKKSLEILTAAYESIETGKTIKMKNFTPQYSQLGIKKA